MKLILTLACSIVVLPSVVLAATNTQTFATSAGPVQITPLNHASTRIEAGGKTIYLDPSKPVNFADAPKADLILITDISRGPYGSCVGHGPQQTQHGNYLL